MKFKTLLSAFVGAMVLAPAANAAAPYSYAIGDKITVDGEELTIKSENLFVNGNFENGWEGWVNGTGATPTAEWWEIAEGGPDGQKYARAAKTSNQGSGNASGLRCDIFEMTPGKIYYFFAYGKNGNSNTRLCTNKEATTSNATNFCAFNSSDEWGKSEGVLRVDASNKYGVIQCGWLGGKEFCLADVSLYEVEAPELEALVEPDTYYRLYSKKGDSYLSAGGGWLRMESEGAMVKDADNNDTDVAYDQVFSFVATGEEGVYNLATSTGEFFVNKDNGWNSNVAASPDLSSIYTQVSVTQKGETISIKVIGRNFLGSDNNAAAGTGVYCDKSGDKTIWFSVQPVEDAAEPDTEAAAIAVDEAMEFVNEATIGTEAGNYSEDAYNALMEAIEAAEEALDAKTQGTVNAAALNVAAALKAFQNSQICVTTTIAESTYKIKVDGTEGYLWTGWKDDVKQGVFRDNVADSEQAVFTVALVEGEENVYTISNVDGYLANTSNMARPTSTLNNNAYYTFETFGVENVYKVKNVATGKYLGTQWGSYYDWVSAATDLGGDASGARLVFINQAPTTGVENVAVAEEAAEYFNPIYIA